MSTTNALNGSLIISCLADCSHLLICLFPAHALNLSFLTTAKVVFLISKSDFGSCHTPTAYDIPVFVITFGIRSQCLRVVDKPLLLISPVALSVVLSLQEFSRNSKWIVDLPKHHVVSYFLALKCYHLECFPCHSFHVTLSRPLPWLSLLDRWPLSFLDCFWTRYSELSIIMPLCKNQRSNMA